MAWTNHYLHQDRDLFREDPWAYGLEKNRRVIAKFLSYCYAQGISAREITPEGLLAPNSRHLTE
jgi:4,5-dihydroxyphthalate decarboxylase